MHDMDMKDKQVNEMQVDNRWISGEMVEATYKQD